jgi:oligoribonuclease NrnB/cAMP/cGMP phosphodiesterase (DHH superfamily)
MGTKIIYHTDPDGYCSAAIASHALWQKDPECQIEYHPINYGHDIPHVEPGDDVYLLDFNLEPVTHMLEMANKLDNRFTWIDHHKTSLDLEIEHPILAELPGIRRVADSKGVLVSACELTWEFFDMYYLPLGPTPEAVSLIGDWDTWRWQQQKTSRAKQFKDGLSLYSLDPCTRKGREFWDSLLFAVPVMVKSVLQQGAVVMNYLTNAYRDHMNAYSFEGSFGEHKAIMVNGHANSEMFNGFYDSTRHSLMVSFMCVRGAYWSVDLYTTQPHLHCGDLAITLGASEDNLVARGSGGGHKNASGFQTSWNHLEKLIKKHA